jgi:hypothetical protein
MQSLKMIKKTNAFKDWICEHYNQNCSIGLIMKPTRFLESKWDTMKHDVVKLIGNFQIVQALQESKTSTKDTKYKSFIAL